MPSRARSAAASAGRPARLRGPRPQPPRHDELRRGGRPLAPNQWAARRWSRGSSVGDQLSRLEAQHLPQQGRVAIPVAARVERIDQPVMGRELGERRPAGAAAGERVGELAVDLLDLACAQQELEPLLRLARRAPRSPGSRSRRGRRRRSCPRRRPHPMLPSSESAASLTPVGQPPVRSSSSSSSRSSSSTPASAHSAASLVAGQGQVGGANLRQAARQAQPLQAQRRIDAGREDQPQRWRRMLGQSVEIGDDLGRSGLLEVVEHEYHGVGARVERVHQGRDEGVEPSLRRVRQRRELRQGDAQRGRYGPPEPLPLAVRCLQPKPRYVPGPRARVDPFAQQGGLPPARGGTEEGERAQGGATEEVAQAGSRYRSPRRAGRHELRGQDLNSGPDPVVGESFRLTPRGSYPLLR